MPNTDHKAKRTVISIEDDYQPQLDFEEAEHSLPFTYPEYQRELIAARIAAGVTDACIVAGIYLLFVLTTFAQMPEGVLDRRIVGVYGAGFLTLAVVYFFLFMLSASQTPGMKRQQLIVVSADGELLDPRQACLRGFGYLISTLPLLLGFIWMVVDPEHLTWADKVSSTYVKRISEEQS